MSPLDPTIVADINFLQAMRLADFGLAKWLEFSWGSQRNPRDYSGFSVVEGLGI